MPIQQRNTMKTTLEISDALLEEARQLAAHNGTTLRAMVEQGLRHVVAEAQRDRPFRLRKVSFKGRGLSPEVADLSWDEIRDLSYGSRSG